MLLERFLTFRMVSLLTVVKKMQCYPSCLDFVSLVYHMYTNGSVSFDQLLCCNQEQALM